MVHPGAAPEFAYRVRANASPWVVVGCMAFVAVFCAVMLPPVVRIIVPIAALLMMALLLFQWRQEANKIARQKVVTATVLTWKKEDDPDGSNLYSITYRYVVDGKSYEGKGRASKELPKEGEAVAVSYEPEKPEKSVPLDAFWFYRFERVR